MWHITINRNPLEKLSLLDVLMHDIGHAIGLDHNSRNDSVMFLYIRFKTFPIKLSIDDILNVQNLYGSKATTGTEIGPTTPTMPNVPSSSLPPLQPINIELCEVKRVDVILIVNHGMYVIYKRYIWFVSLDGRSFSKPMLVTDYLTFFRKISPV